MKFIAKYNFQNCNAIFKGPTTIVIPYEEHHTNIPGILAKAAKEVIIHPCCYREWGVAIPVVYEPDWSDDE